MSMQAICAAFAMEGLSTTRKFVLIALCNYANTANQCFPSQKTLARDTAMSERTVSTALGELEAEGFISRKHRYTKDGHRRSDMITVNILPAIDACYDDDPPAKNVSPPETESPANLRLTTDLGEPVAGITTLEPRMNPKEEPARARANGHTIGLDVMASRIFMAAHPAHRERCGDDPIQIERELKSAVADGYDATQITEVLSAYYAHPKQQEYGGRFAKRFLNAFLERKWVTWRPEGARPTPLKEIDPEVAIGPDQSISFEGFAYKIPAGRTASMVGTNRDPGIRRQVDWMKDWRENPARWTVHEQGPRPGEPDCRVWPSVLERFGVVLADGF